MKEIRDWDHYVRAVALVMPDEYPEGMAEVLAKKTVINDLNQARRLAEQLRDWADRHCPPCNRSEVMPTLPWKEEK